MSSSEIVRDVLVLDVAASTSTVTKSAEEYIAQYGNKSKAIRSLLDLNYSRSDVAKMLNIRYQFVRNVQLLPLKK